MRSFRWTLIFGLIIAGLVGFTVYDYKKSEKQNEQKRLEARVIQFEVDQIQKFELFSGEEKIALELKNDIWHIAEPLQDTADQQAVITLLTELINETSRADVAEGEEFNLEPYGLDKPLSRITMTTKDGRNQEVKIGSVRSLDDNLYAQINDQSKVLLVSSTWEEQLTKSVRELRDKNLFRNQLVKDPVRLQIRQPKLGPAYRLEFEKDDKGWKFAVGGGGDGFPINSEAVASFVEQVRSLRGIDILEDDKAAKGVLGKYKLSNPEIEISLYGTEKSENFEVKVSGELPDGLLPGAKDENNLAVVSSDVTPVISLYRPVADSLRKSAQDFYDKKLPFRFEGKEVAKIKIFKKTGKEPINHELVKKGEVWESTQTDQSTSGENKIDSQKVSELVGKLGSLEAVRVLPPTRPGQKLDVLGDVGKIELSEASGKTLFEMNWGAPVKSAVSSHAPEAVYLPVRTNLSDRTVGVPEAMISGLGIENLAQGPVAPSTGEHHHPDHGHDHHHSADGVEN